MRSPSVSLSWSPNWSTLRQVERWWEEHGYLAGRRQECVRQLRSLIAAHE